MGCIGVSCSEMLSRPILPRGVVLGLGLGGALVLLVGPPSCVIPDNCIAVPIPTVDVCKTFANAEDLTTGLPLLSLDGGELPRGCRCMEQAAANILLGDDADVESGPYQILVAELDGQARAVCVEIAVSRGLSPEEHNCMTEDAVVGPFAGDSPGSCESSLCTFGGPRCGGKCPPDGTACPGAETPVPPPAVTDGGQTSSDNASSGDPAATDSTTGPGADSTG